MLNTFFQYYHCRMVQLNKKKIKIKIIIELNARAECRNEYIVNASKYIDLLTFQGKFKWNVKIQTQKHTIALLKTNQMNFRNSIGANMHGPGMFQACFPTE